MRLRWNTTLGLGAIVAGTAILAALALSVSAAISGGRGNPLLGVALVVASACALCRVYMARAVDRRTARGESLSRLDRAQLTAASFISALLTIGLSATAVLAVFGILTGIRWDGPRESNHDLRNPLIVIPALLAGMLAGLAVGFLTRRAFDAGVSRSRRMVRLSVAISIGVLLGCGETMRPIVLDRLGECAKHEELGSNLEDIAPKPETLDSPFSKLREYHKALSTKWRYYAWRPWAAVEPDPPEPMRFVRASRR